MMKGIGFGLPRRVLE